MRNYAITSTEKKAIEKAKDILRQVFNVKRLSYSIHKNLSITCDCGETNAVEVTAEIKKEFHSQIVGICSNCKNV